MNNVMFFQALLNSMDDKWTECKKNRRFIFLRYIDIMLYVSYAVSDIRNNGTQLTTERSCRN
jgi:hypothetical protein